jgi:hypothetical protein
MKKLLPILLFALLAAGCTTRVQYTSVEIRDAIRHYYPILQGQELLVNIRVNNTGKVPLVVKDIQPSCGCILLESDHEFVVPPDRSMTVTLRYDSRKNVGRVEHSIRFWGNILPDGMAEMRFDVNVVPDANYHHDYEEMYDKSESARKLKEYMRKNGEVSTGFGYYVDR